MESKTCTLPLKTQQLSMTTSISHDYTVIMVAPSNGNCWDSAVVKHTLLLQKTSDTSLSPQLAGSNSALRCMGLTPSPSAFKVM